MTPAISRTSAESTLYEVLSLTPKHLEDQLPSTQQKIIKQAYHKALLKHHPDKKPQDSPNPSPSTLPQAPSSPKHTQSKSSSSVSRSRPTYTIDQIQHAYSVLSDARQRGEYDRELLLASSLTSPARKHAISTRFHTGIETVDLDDLEFDEQTGLYYGPCRCGNERGFQFTEEQLAEYEDDLVLTVQCLDCSLWMRVLFDTAEESEDEQRLSESYPADINTSQHADISGAGDRFAPAAAAAVSPNQASDQTIRTAASSGRSWNFNLSFGFGVSLSTSGPAGASVSANAQRQYGRP
ncbi:hypothetical protein GGS21DRAFT_538331 [Xylaria nigripes]|nr:hypothetical protein GGS21DRAFT_538331 [Xylaria nigripes]